MTPLTQLLAAAALSTVICVALWQSRAAGTAQDVTVGGFVAQKLRETNVIAPWGSSEYTSFTYPNPMLTRYADGVVYTWNAWPGEYDTLMWFSASPGQFWSGPGMNDDPYARLTVLDTSTVIVDGVPLRQLLIERSLWEWAPPDTLRERMGFSFNYLDGWSWFITDQPWSGLRCYTDDEITFTTANVTDCGLTLRVHERRAGGVLLLAPNPGTTHFTLSGVEGAASTRSASEEGITPRSPTLSLDSVGIITFMPVSMMRSTQKARALPAISRRSMAVTSPTPCAGCTALSPT